MYEGDDLNKSVKLVEKRKSLNLRLFHTSALSTRHYACMHVSSSSQVKFLVWIDCNIHMYGITHIHTYIYIRTYVYVHMCAVQCACSVEKKSKFIFWRWWNDAFRINCGWLSCSFCERIRFFSLYCSDVFGGEMSVLLKRRILFI